MVQIKWGPPQTKKIVVLEGFKGEADELVPLFDGEPFIVVKQDLWYITPKIILDTFFYLFKTHDLRLSYVAALLKSINPAIVVTFTDNSLLFHKAAKLYKLARFLAIQNGGRYLARDNSSGSPTIFHSEFVCFGQHEVDQYTKHGAIVEKFYPVGSLRDSYYRALCPKQSSEKKYDLCLVSQIKPNHHKVYPKTMESLDLLARHLKVFCENHGTTLCIASRRHPDKNKALFQWETKWFRERLGDLPHIIPNVSGEFTSYSAIDSSKVSLAMHTTLLQEGFGRHNRVLSCNFSGDSRVNFPIPGPWSLTDPDYEVFEERLLSLLKMSDVEYEALCTGWPKYLIGYDSKKPTHEFIRQLIADAVRGVTREDKDHFGLAA